VVSQEEAGHLKPIFETARLTIRPFLPTDTDDLLLIFSDPVAMEHFPGMKDRGATEKWLETTFRLYERDGFALWAAFLKEDGSFVGAVGLVRQDVEGVDETEIGYLLRRQYWGLGLATEAAEGCREYAFGVLGKTRVISLIGPTNVASQRVAEKVGLRRWRDVVQWNKTLWLYALERREGAGGDGSR